VKIKAVGAVDANACVWTAAHRAPHCRMCEFRASTSGARTPGISPLRGRKRGSSLERVSGFLLFGRELLSQGVERER
jgi:hypothetical protein